jgi:hypothetical protein
MGRPRQPRPDHAAGRGGPELEDRFGVRVVQVGFDILHLSVAAPPVTTDHALQVAAEQFAFCPDNIQQGGEGSDSLAAYAEQIRGKNSWWF